MAPPALSADEMMAWLDRTSTNWHELLEAHPEILAIPCDVRETTTAGGLLQHIVAVELRYAERLSGLAATDYAAIPFDSAESIFQTHELAMALMREQLASGVDWDERIEFVTRSMGTARSSRKAVLFHAMLHGIRHYAQLATLVRQHGIKAGFPMDYIVMDMEPV